MIKSPNVYQAELSKAELLALLEGSNRPITARQLERWSKATHVDRPTRRHVSGVRGSVSYFPARAFGQAAALYDAGRPLKGSEAVTDRRLRERAFLLWWSGNPIVYDTRQLLLRFARNMLDAVDRMRDQKPTPVIGDDPGNLAFETADAFVQEHQPQHLKWNLVSAFSDNLAGDRNDLASVMTFIFTGALGGTLVLDPSPCKDEPSLAQLVLQAVGFSEVPSEETPEEQIGGLFEDIDLFADRDRLADFVRYLSDEELSTARQCARVFFEDLPAIFEMQGVLFGKRATARVLKAFCRMTSVPYKAVFVIAMAWLLRKKGSPGALHLLNQIKEEAPKAKGLCKAVKAFPKYRKLFLLKNQARLGALPEELRLQMLAVIKTETG